MRLLLVSTAVALACLVAPVLAQPAAGDAKSRGDAEALTGQKLYEQGQFHDAATHFVAAYQADPQPAYLFNIAQAYRFAKECANAAKYFRQFLDATKGVQAQNLDKVHHYIDEMDECVKAEAPQEQPQQPATAVAPAPTPAAPAMPAESSDPGHGKRQLGLALGAVGIVGLAIGGYYTYRVGAIGTEAQDWVNANCHTMPNMGCDAATLASQQSKFADKGHSAEAREAIAYSAGGAALAAGVVLYMLGRASDEHAVAAVPTRGGALVTAGFSF